MWSEYIGFGVEVLDSRGFTVPGQALEMHAESLVPAPEAQADLFNAHHMLGTALSLHPHSLLWVQLPRAPPVARGPLCGGGRTG